MLIREAPFVIVDVETTGTANSDRIIELAAVKLHDGKITDRFSQLINPERSVPARITRMTGLTTAALFEKPTAAQVLPEFVDFLGAGVFVAHNVPFDRRFLNAELARIDRPSLANDTLCTLRLARRLLRGLPSKGLTSVADFYDIAINGRHRALGDTEATAEILRRFLRRVDFEHEIQTLEELLAFQRSTYSKTKREPRHLKRIRREVLDELPKRPGVYFMKDHKGVLLYIGKAKSLRARVRSYFTGQAAKPARTRKLVRTLRAIDWQETGSELQALLLESKLIKKHKPRFNRAGRRYRSRPFLRLDTSAEFPRLSHTSHVRDDGAEYFGPLSSRRTADFVVDLIRRSFKLRECDDERFSEGRRCLYAQMDRCNAPCESGDGAACYDVEVQRVRDFLTGRDDTVLTYLEEKMQAAAEQLEFEKAKGYRDGLQKLERLMTRQQQIAAPVLEHNAVIVQPAARPGQVRLFVVRFGRLVETLTVSAPLSEEEARLRERLAAHFDSAQERPERYFKKEVEEVRLLAQWMYKHRDRTEQVRWTPNTPLDELADGVLDEARRVLEKETQEKG